jgi:hypothetical protein
MPELKWSQSLRGRVVVSPHDLAPATGMGVVGETERNREGHGPSRGSRLVAEGKEGKAGAKKLEISIDSVETARSRLGQQWESKYSS